MLREPDVPSAAATSEEFACDGGGMPPARAQRMPLLQREREARMPIQNYANHALRESMACRRTVRYHGIFAERRVAPR